MKKKRSLTFVIAVALILTVVACGPKPVPASAPVFADVPVDHPGFAAIESLFQQGYVVGCQESPRLFCPDRNLTMAEASVLAYRLALGPDAILPEPDIVDLSLVGMPWDHWAVRWVVAAKNAFLVSGPTPVEFYPDEPATRGWLAVSLAQALYALNNNGQVQQFPYEMWWDDGIQYACIQIIMDGWGADIGDPQKSILRYEAAEILATIVREQGQYNH